MDHNYQNLAILCRNHNIEWKKELATEFYNSLKDFMVKDYGQKQLNQILPDYESTAKNLAYSIVSFYLMTDQGWNRPYKPEEQRLLE
jgi:hypothetical protein